MSRLAGRARAKGSRLAWQLSHEDGYLFDHVPRTAGSYFAEILEQLLGSTSDIFDAGQDFPTEHPEEMARLDQYRVINGHLRQETVAAFRRIRPRRLISVVREPLAQIESHYTFWRYNITEDLPHCNLAKQLPFAEFIRVPELRTVWDNPHTRHFFSLWDLEKVEVDETTLAMAVKMAGSYDFIGVTERLEESTQAFMKLFPTRGRPPETKHIDRNASKGRNEMTPADAEYLREINQLDLAIYRHVNQALDRILHP